eukprot:CAMPEP_0170521694 /NCGR_PEP_ID=MMETSP0209-20121228/7059_1 /TAXON_ID=665100 ORGANISM="Litonotus pictus, Strain P1" /NCGR_SAMPLE_ID=MMETSP0209 /ASSEMBLY_ACC=CAM_ASM_000301 /LENGTH=796 /DNA_ID=CAMNT_0010808703 /DNA_START=73 /DNA_END=2463 /DNA_ORIENTATION=-
MIRADLPVTQPKPGPFSTQISYNDISGEHEQGGLRKSRNKDFLSSMTYSTERTGLTNSESDSDSEAQVSSESQDSEEEAFFSENKFGFLSVKYVSHYKFRVNLKKFGASNRKLDKVFFSDPILLCGQYRSISVSDCFSIYNYHIANSGSEKIVHLVSSFQEFVFFQQELLQYPYLKPSIAAVILKAGLVNYDSIEDRDIAFYSMRAEDIKTVQKDFLKQHLKDFESSSSEEDYDFNVDIYLNYDLSYDYEGKTNYYILIFICLAIIATAIFGYFVFNQCFYKELPENGIETSSLILMFFLLVELLLITGFVVSSVEYEKQYPIDIIIMINYYFAVYSKYFFLTMWWVYAFWISLGFDVHREPNMNKAIFFLMTPFYILIIVEILLNHHIIQVDDIFRIFDFRSLIKFFCNSLLILFTLTMSFISFRNSQALNGAPSFLMVISCLCTFLMTQTSSLVNFVFYLFEMTTYMNIKYMLVEYITRLVLTILRAYCMNKKTFPVRRESRESSTQNESQRQREIEEKRNDLTVKLSKLKYIGLLQVLIESKSIRQKLDLFLSGRKCVDDVKMRVLYVDRLKEKEEGRNRENREYTGIRGDLPNILNIDEPTESSYQRQGEPNQSEYPKVVVINPNKYDDQFFVASSEEYKDESRKISINRNRVTSNNPFTETKNSVERAKMDNMTKAFSLRVNGEALNPIDDIEEEDSMILEDIDNRRSFAPVKKIRVPVRKRKDSYEITDLPNKFNGIKNYMKDLIDNRRSSKGKERKSKEDFMEIDVLEKYCVESVQIGNIKEHDLLAGA